jgi:monoamine oxidase
MLGFVDGDDARVLSDQPLAVRRQKVLENYVAYFGQQAANPINYVDWVWDLDPWSRGCPVCAMPPGAYVSFGPALKNPVGRIHWAGTETAEIWSGYMDGAVRSGERAARDVLASL